MSSFLSMIKMKINQIRSLFATSSKPYSITETQIDMKYLVVGLGNIGSKYQDTRHNIGFEVVDQMARKYESTWTTDKLGDLCEVKYKGRSITLLKPSTYMNLSGKAVKYWMDKLKISQDNTLIIVDDLHLDFGKLRMRTKGSDAGHNGLKDIQEKLGGSNYPRLKIGIGDDFGKGQQVDYVLGKWSLREEEGLGDIKDKAVQMIESFVSIGAARTMNQYNH